MENRGAKDVPCGKKEPGEKKNDLAMENKYILGELPSTMVNDAGLSKQMAYVAEKSHPPW